MIKLIPTPKKYEIISEKFHYIENKISVAKKEWNLYIDTFKETYKKAFDIEITDGEGGFEIIEDNSLAPEAYRIESDKTFKIFASDIEGLNYGLVSAYQLVKTIHGKTAISELTIEDAPEKDYRAYMVDLRRWHPFNSLLHYVDACYLAKIKYLHLHFIDDGGYTLPSKVFPKLPTEGHHYTFEQIEQLKEYAKARNIILIPEYECPGHSKEFIKKYPEIFANNFEGEQVRNDNDESVINPVEITELVDDITMVVDLEDTICPTSEKAWEATKALIKEICDMFPDSPYINVGADEANIAIWAKCKCCKEYMKEHNIKDEYELYTDYVAKVTDYVFTLGKTPMVWEGFSPKGAEKMNKDTIVIAWDTRFFPPDELVKAGFRVLNASWKPMYIVDSLKYRWGAYEILKCNVNEWISHAQSVPCFLNPIRVDDTDKVLGGMVCEWDTYYELSIQHAIEKLGALSERTWTVKRVCFDHEYEKKHGQYQRLVGSVIREI